jgi:hypothetical protein
MKKKPSEFPLPEPIELAKLAATLRPGSQPALALKVAMEFYIEAVFFCRESSSMGLEDIIAKFGSEKRWLAQASEPIKKAVAAQWADTLELDPEKDDDPARQYLAEHGLQLKRARSVLDNFRRYYNKPLPEGTYRLHSRLGAEAVIEKCERITAEGKKTYAMPKSILDGMIHYAKDRSVERKRESWRKRKAAKRHVQKPSNKKS